jgi:hypothetical protein
VQPTALTSLSLLPVQRGVFIYGTGRGGRFVHRALRLMTDLEVAGFVDTHEGGVIDGVPAYTLVEFRALALENVTLIIASTFFDEILKSVSDLPLGSCFDGRPLCQASVGFDETIGDDTFVELFNLSSFDIAGFRLAPKGAEKTRPPTPAEATDLVRHIEPILRRLVTGHVDIDHLGSLLGNTLRAVDQDFRNPQLRTGFAGPLNGQYLRATILRRLDAELGFDAFVETGAFRGTTTEWFATLGRPVFSCELDEDIFYFSLSRLAQYANVQIVQQDSCTFLTRICAEYKRQFQIPFFYLDAHWNDDLPLFDEIDTIVDNFDNYIIMADDFKNPFYPYQYDSYGPDAELTMDCMLPRLRNRKKLSFLFPNFPQEVETGARRGTLVIAPISMQEKLLGVTSLLRPFSC